MKKIILCLVIALSLSATSVFAQNSQDQRGKMQQMMKQYLKDSLQLSDVLTDSVMAVRMQYQPQMRQIFMDQSMSADDKQTKLKSMRTEMEARYKTIGLTDDQITKMREHDQRMREQMRNRNNSQR
jgi:predicted transcriptional regulator